MGLQKLCLDTMPILDAGKASEGFQALLQQAVLDCNNRPLVNKPRTVSLQLEITPVADTGDNIVACVGAKGIFKMRLRVPDRKAKEVDFAVTRNGELMFNQDSPDNAKQGTLLPEEQ